MRFNNTEVFNFDGALRGMRNPLNSWNKSDSSYQEIYDYIPIMCGADATGAKRILSGKQFVMGENDLNLAQRLIKGGSEHRKFMRQITVSVDITAPLYWWKEFDTYKVGTTANSTSTMHKLATTPITLDCFEIDDYEKGLVVFDKEPYAIDETVEECVEEIICICETLRKRYLETKDKKYWKELIRWLPESWLQTRTVTMNYENLRNMYFQRKNHKLTEWSESFIKWVESLPYAKELIMYEG